MASLADTIRRLTGAGDDVTDETIADALADHRVRHVRVPVCWEYTVDSENVRTYVRGSVGSWGRFEPTSSSDGESIAAVVVRSDNDAVSGAWSIEQDGTITFEVDQVAWTGILVTAFSYDVSSAAADVADAMMATTVAAYDVKLGDQTFYRSQLYAQERGRLESLASSLRAKALPVVAQFARLDEPVRRTHRRRRR